MKNSSASVPCAYIRLMAHSHSHNSRPRPRTAFLDGWASLVEGFASIGAGFASIFSSFGGQPPSPGAEERLRRAICGEGYSLWRSRPDVKNMSVEEALAADWDAIAGDFAAVRGDYERVRSRLNNPGVPSFDSMLPDGFPFSFPREGFTPFSRPRKT